MPGPFFRQCLRLIHDELERERGKGPVTAIQLAGICGLVVEHHEACRRRIRLIIKYAREHEGVQICAGVRKDAEKGCDLGYWLANSPGEWTAYQESRKSNARFEFVRVSKMKRASAERLNGQQKLFEGGATQWAGS